MRDKILVSNLEVRCIVGTLPHERANEQCIYLDLELEADVSAACNSDDLADTVDYVQISDAAREVAVNGKFELIEALAESIARKLFEFPRIDALQVTIKKPDAIPGASYAGFTIRRTRDDGGT
ncbi:MAG: dihydroneopterin aldolase [Planctomycetes bacterium]|nr:dihydroneopterin aldolase [Planctomycetota bacterium]